MPLSGIISRAPRLSMPEWLRFVDDNEALVRHDPRVIVNPFTGSRVVHQSNPANVSISVDGVTVGGIEPSSEFDDDGELHVFTPEEADGRQARAVATAIAKSLGARLEWLLEDN
jgi:hypothetical protein